MNCCICGKKLDISKNDVPPTWYGIYPGGKLTDVICPECIADPEKKAKWKGDL